MEKKNKKNKNQKSGELVTEKRKYPTGAEHYELYEEIGHGVSASVRRAFCKPLNEIVAVKILDCERENSDLDKIFREAQTMMLVDHPNVLKSNCSFVSGQYLWVVMPFMAGGSCLHILKAAHPDGFDEVVIATILREILKGLSYLHHHGHIHRDVKAGNILVDAHGAVKLGDFGVSACLYDSGDRQRVRNTFVGTPCWMAPEVMEQLHGYDFKADIWSFGITAIELAHGHAPFSRYPPMKVLLMTLQSGPPSLTSQGDDRFSETFSRMIATCLIKDPSRRPSAKKLLKHSFFKQARSNDYIQRKLLEGLPPLGDRIKELKRKDEALLAQRKAPDGQREEMSQNEYKRGVSGWHFDLDFVKAQASLIKDDDDSDNSHSGSSSSLSAFDLNEEQLQVQNLTEISDTNQSATFPSEESTLHNDKIRCNKSDGELSLASSIREQQISHNSLPHHDDRIENNLDKKSDLESKRINLEAMYVHSQQRSQCLLDIPIKEEPINQRIQGDSDKLQGQLQSSSNCNAEAVPHPLDDVLFSRSFKLISAFPFGQIYNNIGGDDELDEKAKAPVVQQKGRFKVTSENVAIEKVVSPPTLKKCNSMQVVTSYPQVHPPSSLPSPCNATSSNNFGYSLFSLLYTALETNIVQRDSILSLMKQVADADGGCTSSSIKETNLLEAAYEREKELLQEIADLNWRFFCSLDEHQTSTTENEEVNNSHTS
ncbi:Serine/threonine protein kinase [Parasponia andersonii]|uniref:Serine/threonine protein kinase n=1 Tax=Parasponia andersonii TaxID=3476 RepID=A0A2P5BVE1_PARAD|nr:Serine/threonine protein kinase [Parasponia andersonii]